VICAKLLFGGFGRRGLEAIVAAFVLVLTNAIVASGLMIIAGSEYVLSKAEKTDQPDLIQVKGRFNRALFETPRRGNLPPLTLPVYEPLIDPEKLIGASGGAVVLMRQSLLRNVVSPDGFLNTYVFGIEPHLEQRVSSFSIARGRFLESEDDGGASLDRVSAQALGVGLGDSIAIRTADGFDVLLTVIGILDDFELRGAPPRTIEAPTLRPAAGVVGGLVTLLLTDVYADRRQQHAILAALGFSPSLNLLILIAVGFCVATVGTLVGILVSALVVPDHFSIPSLMADLGPVEPQFNWIVGGIPAILSMTACGVGLIPVAWRLSHRSLAPELTGGEP